jgi:diacylglycerol kinase family enzyme
MIDTTPGAASVMIVNNAYAPSFAADGRLRPRLDAGQVWVYFGGGMVQERSTIAATVHAAEGIIHKQALRAAFGTERVVITSDRPDVPIAVDGELRPDLLAPFEVASRPAALRLAVPADPRPRTVEVALSW